MGTLEELKLNLKSLVSGFRLSELQELLTSLGRNKNGQKRQLVERVYHIIDGDCSSAVQTKIRSLAERMRMETGQRHWNDHSSAYQANSSYSANIMPSSIYQGTQSYTPCSITFIRLPFYDFMNPIMQAVKLTNSPNSRTQLNELRFSLNQSHVQAIKGACHRAPNGEMVYQVQVQLRFCLFVNQPSIEQPDNLPPNLSVKVNNENVTLPQPKPCRPTEEPKRPGLPIDITRHVHLRPGDLNTLTITWSTTQQVREYAIIISLVSKKTPEELLQRLRDKGSRALQISRDLLMRNFSGDADFVVSTQVVSLTCPLSMVRVSIPLRSNTCRHVQCFDALTFLRMNEKKPTWVCPACSQPAPFHNLQIDDFLMDILRRAKSNEVVFDPSGAWKENAPETNDLLSDDEDDIVPPPKQLQPTTSQPPTIVPPSSSAQKSTAVVPPSVAPPVQQRQPEPQNLSTNQLQPPRSQPPPIVPRPTPPPPVAAPAPAPPQQPLRNIVSEPSQITAPEAHSSSSHLSHGHAKCPRCSGHQRPPPPVRLPPDMPSFIDLTASDDEDAAPPRPPPPQPTQRPPFLMPAKEDVASTGSNSNSVDADEIVRPSRRRHLSDSNDGAPILFETATSGNSNKRMRVLHSSSSSSGSDEEDQNRHDETGTTPPTEPASINDGPSGGEGSNLFQPENLQPSVSTGSLPSISSMSSLTDLLLAPSVVSSATAVITTRPNQTTVPQQQPISSLTVTSSVAITAAPPPTTATSAANTMTATSSRPVITSITSLSKMTSQPPPPQSQTILHPPTLHLNSNQMNHQMAPQQFQPTSTNSGNNNSRNMQPSGSSSNNIQYQSRIGGPPVFSFSAEQQQQAAQMMQQPMQQQQQQLAAFAQMAAAAIGVGGSSMQQQQQLPPIAHQPSSTVLQQQDQRRYVLQQQQQQFQQQQQQMMIGESSRIQSTTVSSSSSSSGRAVIPPNMQIGWQQQQQQMQQMQRHRQQNQPSPPLPPLYPLNEQQPSFQSRKAPQQLPPPQTQHHLHPMMPASGAEASLPLYSLPAPSNPTSIMAPLGNNPFYHHQHSNNNQIPPNSRSSTSNNNNNNTNNNGSVATPPPLQLFHPR